MQLKFALSENTWNIKLLRCCARFAKLIVYGYIIALTPLHSIADTHELSLVSPAPGVYVHLGLQEVMSEANAGEIANIGFIVGDQSVMVIDPGGNPQQGQRLFAAIKQVTDLPVSHIVLTHFHPDHVFGGKSFSKSGQFVAHRRYPLAMTQRAEFYAERFRHLNVGGKGGLVDPDILVSDTLSVDLGNRLLTLTAYETAHTDHDLTILDSRTGTLWASDLLFTRRIPSLDGSVLGWFNVTQSLLADERIKLVIPGHGAPSEPTEAFSAQLNYLDQLIQQTREAVKHNVGLAQATETIAMDERGKWLLFDERHSGNVTKAYTELEWE